MSHVAAAVAALAALAALSLLAGCGGASTNGTPAAQPYQGPLHVARADAAHPRAGAAGDVVSCDTWGHGGSSDQQVYESGATADTPDEALDVGYDEGGFDGAHEGLLVAKEEEDRVLYVVEVAGVIKQAVIVHDGPATQGAGGPGWYVESWATCDYSELPRAFTDSIGLQIWSGPDGSAAPTTEIESWTGPTHCDWQSMTFLDLPTAGYVRAPLPELADHFAGRYEEHATLPAGAVDTGYQHDGEHLWLSPDRQRAFVGTRTDVEVWPRVVDPVGCD